MNKKSDSEFWKDINNNEIPDSLKDNLSKWQFRLPIREDFKESNFLLFYEYNWIHILYGLNLLNIENLKKHMSFLNDKKVDYSKMSPNIIGKISHKNFIQFIRNTNLN